MSSPAPPLWSRAARRSIRGIDALNHLVLRGVIWLTLLMVLVGSYNAISRYVDKSFSARLASNAWIELSWYLFSLVFLLAAPHALKEGAHVRVDVFYGRLSKRGKHWIDFLGALLLAIPFCLFALVASWPSVLESIHINETSADPGGLLRWPIKAVIPIAFVLLLLAAIAEALRHALALFDRSQA